MIDDEFWLKSIKEDYEYQTGNKTPTTNYKFSCDCEKRSLCEKYQMELCGGFTDDIKRFYEDDKIRINTNKLLKENNNENK